MGFFSNLFQQQPRAGAESKASIARLNKWEQTHFPNNCYNFYRTENGERISLQQIRTPSRKSNQSGSFLGKIKEIFDTLDQMFLPSYIANYRNAFHKEIQTFQNNLKKLESLHLAYRNDPLFEKIDHVFHTKLHMLYNELLFCQFDRLGEAAYFQKMDDRMSSLRMDMLELNKNFSDYMYALTRAEYENTTSDQVMIQASVEAMAEVADEYERKS